MRTIFETTAAHAISLGLPGEVILCTFAGETSDFIRFNQARVRQVTSVTQMLFTISLIVGQRRISRELTLAGDGHDRDAITATIAELRDNVAWVPEDPYLLYARTVNPTEQSVPGTLPTCEQVIECVREFADHLDFVGFYAGGIIYNGFANSLGQRNWHAVECFNFDWCLYLERDKAVKSAYVGTHWSPHEFSTRVRNSADRLEWLRKPAITLVPDAYRAYLAPAAMTEILRTLCWEGFSEKAIQTRQSALTDLFSGERSLHADCHLRENLAGGLAPGFTADGFVKPGAVTLITQGRGVCGLANPRSATEFGKEPNADVAEMPVALDLAPGTLREQDILNRLGTGIWISNLWYLNYSDRQQCRLTGMTRFACFWVEKGEIVAPIQVLRFDDTLYRILGTELEALTEAAEIVPDGDTYRQRSAVATRTPGALVRSLRFTL
jgi:predicted Zn-dependent protease